MKNTILVIALSIICVFKSYSQIIFEKGYFIDNSNQRIECLIKNVDWKNNPTQFKYKISPNDKPKTLTIDSAKEFGINNGSKYIRADVNIDRSSEDVNLMSFEKDPLFAEEQLYLKVLVEGKASLFLFKDSGLTRFFFKKDSSDIAQLVYGSYRTTDSLINEVLIKKNFFFREQLLNNLKCANTPISSTTTLNYDKIELVRLFSEYNECENQDFINYEKRKKKNLFTLNIRPGINNSSLFVNRNSIVPINIDFGNKLGLRFGIETEFMLPFNKNKWSILFEPTYQYYKSETTEGIQTVSIDYKSIELPFGLRHYFYLGEKSRVFINGLFVVDINKKPVIDFELNTNLEISPFYNCAIGFGYSYKNQYNIELRYYTGRDIISNYMRWMSDYSTISVIFGYSIFQRHYHVKNRRLHINKVN